MSKIKIKQGNNGSKVHEWVWFWQFHFKLEQGKVKHTKNSSCSEINERKYITNEINYPAVTITTTLYSWSFVVLFFLQHHETLFHLS